MNKRIYISTPMTYFLWFACVPLAIFWMILPVYMIWKQGVVGGTIFLLISGIPGLIWLRWIHSKSHVSYDDKYLYVKNFFKETKVDLGNIKTITQGSFDKVSFEIKTKDGNVINFVSKYSFKLYFGDWPEGLLILKKRIGVESASRGHRNPGILASGYDMEECLCAYELRMEVALDTISAISIDGKILEETEERLVTQDIRYFVFNGDTTGYEDIYGRRQGYYIIKRKTDMLKSLYKDGVQLSCELLSLEGQLIRKEKDCHPFIGPNRK